MKNGCVEDEFGNKIWYKDGKRHREDGPALVCVNGFKGWYQNGRYHREDGPAVEHVDRTKEWYYKGVFAGKGGKPDPTLWARLTSVEANGGPLLNGCFEDLEGAQRWYKDDQLHREDGPAIDYPGMYGPWYFNGERLGWGDGGFWTLWDRLTPEQRGNPALLRWMPR